VVVEPLRLHRVDARGRALGLHGQRNPGREPAAGRRDRHHVGREPRRHEILDDLASGGTLAGDDQHIVVGRHQGRVAARGDVAGDRLAVLALAIVEHHLGAELGGALTLGPWRVLRHDYDGWHVEQFGGRGDALRVIAGRIGDDASRPGLRRQRGELVVGAPELERAGALQRLRLEKHPSAGARVERGRSKQRGAQGHALQAARRRVDVGGRRQGSARLGGDIHRRHRNPGG
jgi:hypothetical protein